VPESERSYNVDAPRVDLPLRCGDCGVVVSYEVPESAGVLVVKHGEVQVGTVNAKIITKPKDILFGAIVMLRRYHRAIEQAR
jgi:hypothetical protein